MSLNPTILLLIILGYFAVLIAISYFTSRNSSNDDFYLAGRKSPWYLVAFGMIGASLSGVTFISVPGWVASSQMSYMQMVVGFILGYAIIAIVLLPLYYRLNLTSIYTYLENRMGISSYKTGSAFFLISRIVGASFRLYLVAIVLHKFVTSYFGLSFAATVLITIILIWIYTHRGGIKTIVYTDTLQTASMLTAVVISIYVIVNSLDWSFSEAYDRVFTGEYGRMFFFDEGWSSAQNFWKQFAAGASIALVMTGLDQDMMQKNLSVKTLGDAQKNMYWFSLVLSLVNVVFLVLGALLYYYADANGISVPVEMVGGKEVARTDLLYPLIALEHLGPLVGVTFIIGLIAAAYSSADSALTALTTAFCVDILGIERDENRDASAKKKTRRLVHVGMSVVLFIVIMIFYYINNDAVIKAIYTVASYTYGPLLGLFAFGLFTHRGVRDKLVPMVCILSPVLTYLISTNSEWLLGGYKFGFELLILNGLITFIGCMLISSSSRGTLEIK